MSYIVKMPWDPKPAKLGPFEVKGPYTLETRGCGDEECCGLVTEYVEGPGIDYGLEDAVKVLNKQYAAIESIGKMIPQLLAEANPELRDLGEDLIEALGGLK